MDSLLHNSKYGTELAQFKQKVLQQMSDMFVGVPLSQIRQVCEECLWNVDLCIDKLISTDSNVPDETTKASYAAALLTTNTESGLHTSKENPIVLGKMTSDLPVEYTNAYGNISKGYKVLLLLRGAPGSGKTHLAQSIIKTLMPGRDYKDFILSADDYFFDSLGRYRYNVSQLDDAHSYCQTRAREKMTLGWSPVIIDNTNVKTWEMMAYVKCAVENGYIIDILEPMTRWRKSASKLALKNAHNVSKHKIERMLNNFEYATPTDLINMLKETKYSVPLPQMRAFPPPDSILSPSTQQPHSLKTQTTVNPTWSSNEEVEKTEYGAPAFSDVWAECISKLPRRKTKDVLQEQYMECVQDETNKMDPQPDNAFQVNDAAYWCSVISNQNSELLENVQETFHIRTKSTPAWRPVEPTASTEWTVPASMPPPQSFILPATPILKSPEKASVSMNVDTDISEDSNEACGLLRLLKEGVKSINVPKKEDQLLDETEMGTKTLQRHSVGCEHENGSFVYLRQIYPNIPVDQLWDLFEKCKGSIDWAVDILLNDEDYRKCDLSNDTPPETGDNFNCGCNDVLKPTSSVPNVLPIPRPKRNSTRNRVRYREVDDGFKEAIERQFVVGEEFFSSHVNNIRNKRYGIQEQSPRKTLCDAETQTDPVETDNDNELDVDDDDDNDTFEIDLSRDIITQLSDIFKEETSALEIPERYKSFVFMPKSLAKEIYLLWVESLYNQIEEQRQKVLKDDEDFARLLNHPKYEDLQQPPQNIKELLDMEYAWLLYKTDKEQLDAGNSSPAQPKDLASHLTCMKLCEIFPDIPKETLLDIYAAHDNNFSDTIEVLRGSLNNIKIDPQESAKMLFEKVKRENEKVIKREHPDSFLKSSQDAETLQNRQQEVTPRKRNQSPTELKRRALTEFEESRNYASHHSQLRAECHRKAKESIQRGNSSVAVYYSQIANLHRSKVDFYNHRAANCISEVHKLSLTNPDYIDLHYLHVVEAIACLDVFIDGHIAMLQNASRPRKYIFIITGRGLHSVGGVSTIKAKVKSRLKERGLNWIEMNPGLLKVRVFANSRFSKSP